MTGRRYGVWCGVASALALAVGLAGCGGGSSPASAQAFPAEEPADERLVEPQATLPQGDYPELLVNGYFASGSTSWNLADAVITSSELRPGGKALDVGWRAFQSLATAGLKPGVSYRLEVQARNAGSGKTTRLAVIFRTASGEPFRTHEVNITSTSYGRYLIEFTAPNYVANAEFQVLTNGTRARVDVASLKQRDPLEQTEVITSPAGSFVPAGYSLAFNDEFNGSALNRAKWFTRMIYAGGTSDRLNDEQQRYRDNGNHVVSDGTLKLIARRVRTGSSDGIDYESGMIRSDWTARYGYFEARVRMPAGLGLSSAFWLNSDVSESGRLAWPPEIDIFEFVNNGVEDTRDMIHSGVVEEKGPVANYAFKHPSFDSTWTFWRAPYDFSAGWHTVGAEWTPDTLTLYIDGERIYTRNVRWNYSDGSLAAPSHIILNLAVGGQWAGRYGVDASVMPQALEVDWVRAYRKVVN